MADSNTRLSLLGRLRTTPSDDAAWSEFVESTKAQYALVEEDSGIAGAMTSRLGWMPVARSATYVLLVPPKAGIHGA